tara:strand:- start:349 stop:534 length:186 start_codon:yes stop_codon:yes gene_type:complete
MEATPFEKSSTFGNNLATSLALHKALEEYSKIEDKLTDNEKEVHAQMLLALLSTLGPVAEA